MAIYDLSVRQITEDLSVIGTASETDRSAAERHVSIPHGEHTVNLHFVGRFTRQDVDRIASGIRENTGELDRLLG